MEPYYIKRRKLIRTIASTVTSILVTDNDDRKTPIPYHNSILTGQLYHDEIMATNNMDRFKDITRCPTKETYNELISCLENNGGLKSSRHISSSEKVLTFIELVRKEKNPIRAVAERFQHSLSTTSDTIHEVKDAIIKCFPLEVRQPNANAPVHPSISNNYRFNNYFDDAIGAIDGSFSDIAVDKDDANNVSFVCRKGYHAFNNFGCVDFDMIFTYFRGGWEGCAHDSKLYTDACLHGLRRRLNEFYLGDGAFTLTMYCLTPYKGVRYHLKEFEKAGCAPSNMKELFNLRHATARNVIERTYGVLKKQFPILNSMPGYSIEDQVQLTLCCVFLYNFIRRRNINWQFADDDDNDDDSDDDDDDDDDNDDDDDID